MRPFALALLATIVKNISKANFRLEGRFVAPGTTLLLAREGDGYTVRLDGEGAEKAKALSADGLRALRIQKRNGWVEAYGGPALNEEAAAPREAAQTASNLNW
jgi:hypothetical protein